MSTIPAYTPPLDEITTALLGLLDLSGRTRADRQGFDAVYAGNPVTPPYPYWILQPIPGGSADPMPDLDGDLTVVTAVWQVTAVSNLRNQAQQLARQLTDLVIARDGHAWRNPLAMPTGWQCIQRSPQPPAGVIRDGDPPNAIYTAPARFTLTLCPA